MLFTGHSDHVIDAKQRLALPARYRDQVGRDKVVWYCVPWPGVGLRLYVDEVFESLSRRGVESLTPGPDEAELETTLFGLAERLEMDGQGRVALPGHLVELAGLKSKDVVIVGVRNRLEVRDRSAWKAGLADRFAKMAQLVERVDQLRPG
ncbi:hypothetical protein J4558_24560 [Leptolyngbya sp. 15MV]|nr:hypothetical protein J4558_24560 [Leptolyngbya sp. 15MV]